MLLSVESVLAVHAGADHVRRFPPTSFIEEGDQGRTELAGQKWEEYIPCLEGLQQVWGISEAFLWRIAGIVAVVLVEPFAYSHSIYALCQETSTSEMLNRFILLLPLIYHIGRRLLYGTRGNYFRFGC